MPGYSSGVREGKLRAEVVYDETFEDDVYLETRTTE